MDMIIDMEAVRNGMRQGMTQMGITSPKLSELTGIPKSTLDKFLDGTTTTPAFDRVCAVARVLNVSIDDLIGIRSKSQPQPVIIPTDIIALQESHKQTLVAKGEHIEEIKKQNKALIEQNELLSDQNKKLRRWKIAFIIENVFLAGLTVADILIPTFGYFRGTIVKKLSSRSLWG